MFDTTEHLPVLVEGWVMVCMDVPPKKGLGRGNDIL
jgi:hypothetical protein